RPLAERAPVQADVAAAEAALRSSRALIDDAVGHAWATVAAGDTNTVDERWSVRLSATSGVAAAAHAIDLMYTSAGGAAIFDDSPRQSVFVAALVAGQQALVAPGTMELLGAISLGLDTNPAQL